MRRFHEAWVATGVASVAKGVPRLRLLSAQPPTAPAASHSVHIQIAAVLVPATSKRAPASGIAVVAHEIGADRSTELLRAHAPVPATATHGRARAWACVAKRHTKQVAQQAAVWAGLTYAEQQARAGRDVTMTVGSVTTLKDLQQQTCRRNSTHETLRWRNIKKFEEINQRQPNVTLRAPTNAIPLKLLAQAEQAASAKDLRLQVTCTGHQTRAVSLWDESRVWDPGD